MTVPLVGEYGGIVPNPNTQSAENFSVNAIDWTSYQANTLGPDINDAISQFNVDFQVVNQNSQDAQDAAEAANLSELSAASSANFKGRWSDASGAATVPSSYENNGRVWQLLQNIPDITADEPMEGAANWLLIDSVNMSNVRVSKIDNPLTHLFKKNKLVDTLSGTLSVTRNSTATYVDRYGVVRTAGVDEPREEAEGWLIEDSSTNLLTYSQDASNAAWLKTGDLSVTPNDAASCIDGELSDRISSLLGGVSNRLIQVKPITDTGQAVTMSLIIAPATVTTQVIRFVSAGGSNIDLQATFDYASESFSSVSTGLTPKLVKKLSNGFYWVSVTAILNGTNSNVQLWTYSNSAGEWLFAGAKIEEKHSATSHIITTLSPVTRLSDDVFFMTGGNIPADGAQFSIKISLKNTGDFTGEIRRILSVPCLNGLYTIFLNNTQNKILTRYDDGVTVAQCSNNINNIDSFTYIVTFNSSGLLQGYVDGDSGTPASVTSLPTIDVSGNVKIFALENLSLTNRLSASITDLRIYDFALNSDEVRYLGGE